MNRPAPISLKAWMMTHPEPQTVRWIYASCYVSHKELEQLPHFSWIIKWRLATIMGRGIKVHIIISDKYANRDSRIRDEINSAFNPKAKLLNRFLCDGDLDDWVALDCPFGLRQEVFCHSISSLSNIKRIWTNKLKVHRTGGDRYLAENQKGERIQITVRQRTHKQDRHSISDAINTDGYFGSQTGASAKQRKYTQSYFARLHSGGLSGDDLIAPGEGPSFDGE